MGKNSCFEKYIQKAIGYLRGGASYGCKQQTKNVSRSKYSCHEKSSKEIATD
jgi:hypothetical protein